MSSTPSIDYTKWDSLESDVESVTEETKDPKVTEKQTMPQTGGGGTEQSSRKGLHDTLRDCKTFMAIQNTKHDFPEHHQLMLAKLNELLEATEGNGDLMRATLSPKDYLSATTMLDLVNPHGLDKRAKGLVKPGHDGDDLQMYLWELTLQLRSNASHAQELLAKNTNALDRLLQVISIRNLTQYKIPLEIFQHTFGQFNMGGDPPVPTPHQKEQERTIAMAIADTHYVLSVIHELCRYREGCVALAQHPTALTQLLRIPFADLRMAIVFNVFLFSHAPTSYHAGMMDQALLDTLGRLINGLDKHKTLRKKVCKKVFSQLDDFEGLMEMIGKDFVGQVEPTALHCIDLDGTMARLRKLIKAVGSSSSSSSTQAKKGWRSTYRIDRKLVPAASKKSSSKLQVPSPNEMGACLFCSKQSCDLKQCSRW